MHFQRSKLTHTPQLFLSFRSGHSFRDREVPSLHHFAKKLRLCLVSTRQRCCRLAQLNERFHRAEIRKHAAAHGLETIRTSFRSHRSLYLYRFGKCVKRVGLAPETALRSAPFGQRVCSNREDLSLFRNLRRRLRKLQRLRIVALLAIYLSEPAQRVGHVGLPSQRRVESQSLVETF